MRFKEDWKRLGYNNPKIKDLDKIMSDEEALEFFNKLMHKYITLKKLDLAKESDIFVSAFREAIDFFEIDWNTWIYRALPKKKCTDDNLSYCDALSYRDVRKIHDKYMTKLLDIIGMFDDFYDYLKQNPDRGRAFIRKIGTACYMNHMKKKKA